MSTPSATTYDDLPYGDNVFAHTQPANLATVAALHGLEPPPLDHCRVLDLGCASGTNLLPMALSRPQSEFVGLDLSAGQVAHGRETVARLGLTNVALHARNLLDPIDDLGTFDYIVCHGVYSWVPPVVQDAILGTISQCLTPNGLAYVSYNTYPGWHLRGMVRDIMTFHAAGADGGPAEKVADARRFLDFLVDALPEQDTSYSNVLGKHAELLRSAADSYVYHEYLESDNRPVYFHQFVEHAAKHGLQYLAEATPQPLPGNLKPGVLDTLTAVAGDLIRLEQYMDFLRCRIFRRNVLCHAAARPIRTGMSGRIPAFAVSSSARPEAEAPDPAADRREMFVVSEDVKFATADKLLRAVLWRLWDARPAAVPFDILASVAGPPTDAAAADMAETVLQLYLAGVLELHLFSPDLVAVPGPRPRATPFARLQAERKDDKIFNLRYRGIDPDPFARCLLPLLDGTRTRPELVETLAAGAAAGGFAIQDNDGRPVTDPALLRQVLAGWLETTLERLAKSALLTA